MFHYTISDLNFHNEWPEGQHSIIFHRLNFSDVTDEEFRQLMARLPADVQAVNFKHCRFRENPYVTSLARYLPKHVTTLKFKNFFPSLEQGKALMQALPRHLETLIFSYTCMKLERAGIEFPQIFSHLPASLKKLRLRRNFRGQLSTSELIEFFKAIDSKYDDLKITINNLFSDGRDMDTYRIAKALPTNGIRIRVDQEDLRENQFDALCAGLEGSAVEQLEMPCLQYYERDRLKEILENNRTRNTYLFPSLLKQTFWKELRDDPSTDGAACSDDKFINQCHA